MISRTAKVFALLSITAFIITFILSQYLTARFGGVDFEPVHAPIAISAGYRYSTSFSVDYQTKYQTSIQCNRVMPFKQLEHLLQTELEGGCIIYEDGIKIFALDFKEPEYGSSSTDVTLARIFPTFPASPSKKYRIECFINKTVPELAQTHPMLIVGMDRIVWKTQFYSPAMLISLVRLVSTSVGLLFLVATSISQINYWMKNRTSVRSKKPV